MDDWYEKDIEEYENEVKIIKAANQLKNDNSEEPSTSNSLGARTNSNVSVPANLLKSVNNFNTRTAENYQKKNMKQLSGRIKTIPFQILKNISEYEPIEMFLEISKQFTNFFETLSADLNTPDHVIQAIIVILNKLCELPLHDTRKYILTKSWEGTGYWSSLLNYVNRLCQHENSCSSKKIVSKSNLSELMVNILGYCKFYIRNLKYDQSIINFLEYLFNIYSAENDKRRLSEIGIQLEYLIREANDNLNQKFYNDIYPSLDDLKTNDNRQLNLKSNLVEGAYPDVRNYIEIQLALLKEDFITPLRDIITKLIANPSTRLPNTPIYKRVKFTIMKQTKDKKYENILIDLNPSYHKHFKSHLNNNSKKFMIGSLVCLTNNLKFENLIIGVVKNRGSKIINDGMIQIDIIKMYNQSVDIFSQYFMLFESEVYFEPYHQVYNILKNLDQYDFPLKNYIIDCDKGTEFPDYMPSESKVKYTYRNKVFDVKDVTSWPTPESIELDKSQFNVFQDALTRKFCMIQGPPGTGKTFIGQQIICALLENTKLQILIISRTNHALDKFLTGVRHFTDKIVRMGSMSKESSLESFNIINYRDDNFKNIDIRIRTSFYKTRMYYTDILSEFEVLQSELGNPKLTVEQKQKINNDIIVVQEKMMYATRRLAELNQISDFYLIKDKRVIGMTTTYAARCSSLLKMIRPPIVIIEETGEVLESHIIATLNENIQHLIMIGDHQQLRPAISVPLLASEYKMDISLIERMINNGINCMKLNTQYRQRPEFTSLIRPLIYQKLFDSESVHKYPNVKGVAQNLFFMNHTNESRNIDEMDVKNKFEAQFIMNFCNYLIIQGHYPNEITILTPYIRQMRLLLRERKKFQMNNVRVCIIDHFQVEENKIILLSLVGNNSMGMIDNLGLENRVCVALSRAREGFYMFGNMKLLRDASPVWEQIELELTKQNAINNYIPLKCPTHGGLVNVSIPQTFRKFRQNGCVEMCGKGA